MPVTKQQLEVLFFFCVFQPEHQRKADGDGDGPGQAAS